MCPWDTAPVFCFTSDIDWASDEVIRFSHESLDGDELELTYFNTHPSDYLTSLKQRGAVRLLVHPNFLPGSDHGSTYEEVMDYCCRLEPDADGLRTHRYFEVNDILDEYARRGFKYVSNHCTRCETHLRPLWHRSGMASMPIFLEDGGFLLMDPSLDLDRLRPRLDAPGLKVINFHPAHMAFNTPDFGYTRGIKDRLSREEWKNLSGEDLAELAHDGHGVRSVIRFIADHARTQRHAIMQMDEVHAIFADAHPCPAGG